MTRMPASQKRDACGKRAPLRLHIEIDGDDPEERSSQGADDPVFEVAGGVVIESLGGEDAGEDQRQRKTRCSGAQVRKPASPPRPGRCLAHCRLPAPYLLAPDYHAPEPRQRVDLGDLVQGITDLGQRGEIGLDQAERQERRAASFVEAGPGHALT
jgi:hypothetical protein